MIEEQLQKFYDMAEPRSENAIRKAEERKMKREDKELLVKDLCARLPYGVKGETLGSKTCTLIHLGKEGDFTADDYHGWLNSGQFIPYLRPMSSMTEEEKFELKQEHVKDQQLFAEVIVVLNNTEMRGKVIPHFAADWCDKNMFDYRGLIDKGLAFEVTEEYNPYKN